MRTGRRTLVTGGFGFVGRRLADALADRGDDVTVLDVVGDAWRPDVRFERVDLRDPAATARAIGGHDVVFHVASRVQTRAAGAGPVWAVNLGGTRHVVDACRAAGVRRLVHVSSASVVYEGRDIEGGDETMPYTRVELAPYASSKVAAEQLVLRANGPDLATCALRPHVVYGPGDARLLPAILARSRAGRLRVVGTGAHLSDFTYVDNLVDALIAAADRLVPGSPVGGQAWFVTDGEPVPFFEFVRRVTRGLGLPEPRGRVPFRLAWGAAAVAEAWDAARGVAPGAEEGLSRFAVRYLCTHHWFRVDKARRDLGWAPGVSLEEGVARTVAALRA